MDKLIYRLGYTFAVALLTGPLWAQESGEGATCHPDQTAVIATEHRCVQNGGIDIGSGGDEGMKVACMQDRRVQGACGPDGSLTRQYAFADWLGKLKQFQETCESHNGTFAYEDAQFTEPQDPSFCMPAEPEVGSNMFEEPLCNFRSVCPAVTVKCSFACQSGTPVAFLH